MRVAMVSAQARPEIGGIESHVAEVAPRLTAAGIDVVMLTTDRSGRLPRNEVIDGVPVARYAAYPRSRDYYFSPGLFRAVLRTRADLVHVQGIHTLVPVVAMVAALLRRTPYVVTFHTGGTSQPLRARLRGVQWRLLAPLLRRAAALVAVSEFEARRFEAVLGWDQGSIRVVRNGGALPASDVEPARPVEVASVGRLERYKGHHRLISALPLVRARVGDVRAKVYGAGPYEDELRRLRAELGVEEYVDIEFVRPDDRQGMADRLSAASVVTLLSDYEAHPVAVMEALDLGRPVVLLRTSGLTEIADVDWAVGVDPDAGPEVVADAICRQLESPIGPDVADLPTWDTSVAGLLDVYAELAG